MTVYKRVLDHINERYLKGSVFSPTDINNFFTGDPVSSDQFLNVFNVLCTNDVIEEVYSPFPIFSPWSVKYMLIKDPHKENQQKDEKIDLSKISTQDLMQELNKRIK